MKQVNGQARSGKLSSNIGITLICATDNFN